MEGDRGISVSAAGERELDLRISGTWLLRDGVPLGADLTAWLSGRSVARVRVDGTAGLELWAEPLRESLPAALAQDLAAELGGARVARPPWPGPAPPDVVVSVVLRRFERTSGRTVELEAAWTIGDGGGGVRLRRDTRLSLPVPSTSTQAAVTAMSDALAGLSGDIAAGLRRPTAGER